MGCGSWTRDSYVSYSTTKGMSVSTDGMIRGSYSNQDMFKARNIDSALDPKNVIRECCDTEEHPNTIPVILALDVTGSMNDVSVEIAKKLNFHSDFEEVRKIEDLINLSDIILDKLENIHIDAKGTVLGEPKSINIGIDISDLNNAEMEIKCWDERNPITGKMERKKKATISFTDYEMNYKLQDENKINILECLWEASKK